MDDLHFLIQQILESTKLHEKDFVYGKRLKANPIKTLTPGKGVLIPGGAAIGAKAFMDVAGGDKGKKDSITIDGGSGSGTDSSKKDDSKP